jgi:hypothetical protein
MGKGFFKGHISLHRHHGAGWRHPARGLTVLAREKFDAPDSHSSRNANNPEHFGTDWG